jgi:hypothetical protein
MQKFSGKTTHILIAYYAVLQSVHLVVLIRAGLLMLKGNQSPFPILPPPHGWDPQVMPFMLGLAAMDILGIILGLIFAYDSLFNGKQRTNLGILSLTIFISGAIVFAAGTLPSGAWSAHPTAYGIMGILFFPTVFLFVQLLISQHGSKTL